MSARSMGMGSVGISELPMRVTACFTSGNCAFRIFSACVSLAPRYLSLLMPMWWHTASTMMTAPSTISPKSIAPRLIRFPLTPKSFIMPNANSMDSGITEATTSPAR